MNNPYFWISLTVCSLSYIGLAFGRVPRLRMDRTGISLVGATLLIALGALSLPDAIASIDFQTIILLFGMMVVVAYLRISGFFDQAGHLVLDRLTHPKALLALTISLSGVLSAFLVNDVICLAMTPFVIRLSKRRGLNPIPYLIALATAANIGSCATIIGNPQNMIIGSLSQIPFAHFFWRLLPPAALGLILNYFLIAWLYDGKLLTNASPMLRPAPERNHRLHARVMRISAAATFGAVILLFSGLSVTLVALGAAALLLVTLGKLRPEKVYRDIDWGLLVMFCGLFVTVHAFETHVLAPLEPSRWSFLAKSPIGLLSLTSAALSNLVSNVPAVLLFKPLIALVPEASRETAWLALAMSSTFAGNLTILGSVANLIVIEGARRRGIRIGFFEYLKVGLPLTLLTLILGWAWLSFSV